MKISAYWKALIAAAGPVLLAAQAAVTDGTITTTEWVTIATAVVVAVGVWRAPNAPKVEDAPR